MAASPRFAALHSADTEAVKSAVQCADVIITATNAHAPLFDGRWVAKGCHLNCIGSYRPNMQEIDEHLVSVSKVAVDTESALREAGDLAIPIAKGLLDASSVRILGAWLLSAKKASSAFSSAPPHFLRSSPDDITIFKSIGTAVQDIATAQAVLEAANSQQIGTVISL